MVTEYWITIGQKATLLERDGAWSCVCYCMKFPCVFCSSSEEKWFLCQNKFHILEILLLLLDYIFFWKCDLLLKDVHHTVMVIPSSTWFQTTVVISSNTWFHTVVVIPRSTWSLKFVTRYRRLNSIFRELDSLAEVEKSRPRENCLSSWQTWLFIKLKSMFPELIFPWVVVAQ